MLHDVGAIAMHGVRLASLGVGDVVVVIGMGMIGQLVAQIARAQGAVVIALDLRPERIELAQRLGADQPSLPVTKQSGASPRFPADVAPIA